MDLYSAAWSVCAETDSIQLTAVTWTDGLPHLQLHSNTVQQHNAFIGSVSTENISDILYTKQFLHVFHVISVDIFP